uniref:Kinesin motor domain-containing protein n=1 Tax=Ascaris lumbricoides TaxID=6252 RepID=A0A9J2Q873_ASCLU
MLDGCLLFSGHIIVVHTTDTLAMSVVWSATLVTSSTNYTNSSSGSSGLSSEEKEEEKVDEMVETGNNDESSSTIFELCILVNLFLIFAFICCILSTNMRGLLPGTDTRIRPQGAREKLELCRVCTAVTPGEPQVTIGGDRSFTYDFVFDQPTPQSTVYEKCVESLVDGTFGGFNATVLAYGQVLSNCFHLI